MSTTSDRVLGTPPTNTSALSDDLPFASLAAALPPHWGKTILRLTQATDRLASRFDRFIGAVTQASTVQSCRDLADELIAFLDGLEDPDQDSAVDDEPCDDESDDEPSLGFLERHNDHSGICAGISNDCEDEHDGGEPEDERGESEREDCEPSLGWNDEETARQVRRLVPVFCRSRGWRSRLRAPGPDRPRHRHLDRDYSPTLPPRPDTGTGKGVSQSDARRRDDPGAHPMRLDTADLDAAGMLRGQNQYDGSRSCFPRWFRSCSTGTGRTVGPKSASVLMSEA